MRSRPPASGARCLSGDWHAAPTKAAGSRVHKAWWISLATLVGTLAAAQAIAHSPVGDGIYRAVVDGHPGEQIGGLDFPPPPAGPLRTGK